MKSNRAQEVITQLEKQGWVVSHSALFAPYKPAGTISAMQTRKGIEYCRVHSCHAKGYNRRGKWFRAQMTFVLSRKAL